MKKLLLTFMLACSILFLGNTDVFYAEEVYDAYCFTLPSAGKFSIKMTSQMENYGLTLYSEDGTKIWSSLENEWNANISSITNTHEMDLSAGDYVLKVNSYSTYRTSGRVYYTYYTGNYSMVFSFASARENFNEPNNDFTDACKINTTAHVVGQMSLSDNEDYFVFSVAVPGRITWDVVSYMEYYSMYLYDAEGNLIWQSINNNWNSNLKKIENTHYVDVAEGTYYCKVSGESTTGKYTLKLLERIPLTETKISEIENQLCTGLEVTPNPVITYGNKTLVNGVDYTTEYSNNVNFGTAIVTITGIGNYAGTVTEEFDIILKIGAKAVSGDYVYQFLSETEVAFAGIYNTKVSDVKISDRVSIGGKKFSVTSIASQAACNNTTIKTVSIPYTVTEIGAKAFYNCKSLAKVTFKGKNVAIGTSAFDKCSKLKTISGGKGSTFSYGNYNYKLTSGSEVAFDGLNKNSVKKVTIAATVKLGAKSFKITSVADKALSGKKVTSVTIGKNVTKIGKQAFENCAKLKAITINTTKLKSVGSSAFKGVHKKAVIKVFSKLKAYKKLMKSKGQAATVTIKKK